MTAPLPDGILLIWIYMTPLYFIALARRDNSIVDIGWGLGFTLIAWWMNWFYPHPGSLLLASLVTAWALRLSGYIALRNSRREEEDWRYARWRRQWGRWVYIRSYLQVFLLQGFLLWVIALPLMDRRFPMPGAGLTWYQMAGLAAWALGFAWEAVADWQLLRFKEKPENKGRIMMSGLWRLSRHPNYFGEIVLWWGLFFLALPYCQWWIALLSPLTITWLLTRVSGVPMLEEKYRDNPVFLDYARRTPPLLPSFRHRRGL